MMWHTLGNAAFHFAGAVAVLYLLMPETVQAAVSGGLGAGISLLVFAVILSVLFKGVGIAPFSPDWA